MLKQFTIVVLGLVAALGLVRPAAAHDVKDPVCRMTVDSDTTKWKHRLGNKSFYFCSKQCLDRFTAHPEKYEKLAATLEKQEPHAYQVDFKTSDDPTAGKPVKLELAVRYADSKQLVREFELVHERHMHLVMTSEDLSWFEHQHPVHGKDGIFRLTWTFPRPGRYRLYADFTPSDGDNQVLPVPLTVGGGEPTTRPLQPDARFTKQVGDLRITLQVRPGLPLRMEKTAALTYTIQDRRGRPVRDLQPFIGAMGHLLAISQDGKEFVHTHSVLTPSHSREAGRPAVTAAMISARGPVLSFLPTLPTGGLYKTWAQFQRAGRVYTVPFTFAVEDLWGQPDAAPSPETPPAAPSAPERDPKIQKATVAIDGGYQPAQVTVRAGRPVELTFVRKEAAGCGSVVQIPELKIRRTLAPGEKTVVAFTPEKPGTLAFTCGMGMYRGAIVVR